jgi:hypothetical protein
MIYDGAAWAAIGGGDSIYTADGTLSGNRILDLDGNSLSFNNQAGNTIISLLDNGSFTLGQGATTANLSCVAIGFNAEATNVNNTIAIGTGSDAKGNYDIAIGYNSSAETNDGIAIGNGAKILTGGFGVAIGKNAESTSGGGISMGVNTKAGTLALALGYVAQATGTYAVSLGYSNAASGVNSVVIGGRQNSVSGDRSVLISTNNSSQSNSVAQTFVVNLNDTTNALYIGQSVDSYYGGSGNFGFGTTTPSSKLTVQGNGTTTGSTFSLYDNDTIPNKTFEVLDNGKTTVNFQGSGGLNPALVVNDSAGLVFSAERGGNITWWRSGATTLRLIQTLYQFYGTGAGQLLWQMQHDANVLGFGVEGTEIDPHNDCMRINGDVSLNAMHIRGNINAINIPTSSAGLSSGDIWNDGGTLKIV